MTAICKDYRRWRPDNLHVLQIGVPQLNVLPRELVIVNRTSPGSFRTGLDWVLNRDPGRVDWRAEKIGEFDSSLECSNVLCGRVLVRAFDRDVIVVSAAVRIRRDKRLIKNRKRERFSEFGRERFLFDLRFLREALLLRLARLLICF